MRWWTWYVENMRNSYWHSLQNSICFDTNLIADAADSKNFAELFELAGSRTIAVPVEIFDELVSVGADYEVDRAKSLLMFFEDPRVILLRPFGSTFSKEQKGKLETPVATSSMRDRSLRLLQGISVGEISVQKAKAEDREKTLSFHLVDKEVRRRFRSFNQSEYAEIVVSFQGIEAERKAKKKEIWDIFSSFLPFWKFRAVYSTNDFEFSRRFFDLFYFRMLLNGASASHSDLDGAKKIHENNWADTRIAAVCWFVEEFYTRDGAYFKFLEQAKNRAKLRFKLR